MRQVDSRSATLLYDAAQAADVITVYMQKYGNIDFSRINLELSHVMQQGGTIAAGIEQNGLWGALSEREDPELCVVDCQADYILHNN